MTPEEIFEDIMQDYVNRTVTMEDHPHLKGVRHASIHPCQVRRQNLLFVLGRKRKIEIWGGEGRSWITFEKGRDLFK